MLEIRIENQPLELTPNTAINITNSSPLFDKDSLDRKFSLPFRIPLTPKNKALRKHANRLDAGKKSAFKPAECRFGGHIILKGEMVQTSVNDTEEEVSIANDPLKIWERLSKIKINEILENFNLMDGRPIPIWEFSMGFTGSYQIVVDGTSASATASSFPEIPTAGASIATQLNTAFPGIANYNASTGRLELDALLLQTHPLEDWVLFTLTEYENIALSRFHAVKDHVLDTNATPIASHCFPLIYWEGFYGDKNFLWKSPYGFRVFNHVVDGNFLENLDITVDDQIYWHNSVLPCVRIPYVLNKISEALGDYIWFGDVWDDLDFQKLIHVPNLALDEVTTDTYDDLLPHKRNTLKPEINLNNLVPAISAAEFINRLCTTFALYLKPANGVLELRKKQTPLQVAPIILDGRISKAVAIEPNTTKGWKLYNFVLPDESYSDPAQMLPVTSGEGEAEIVVASTLPFIADVRITTGHIDPTRDAKMAATTQPGRSPAMNSSDTKSTMPLTLLFCHGLQPDENGDNYVLATHDNLNYDGDEVGAYSMDPATLPGLYEKWHKGVIEYANSSVLNATAYLHEGEIEKILEWESGRIQFYHPEGVVTAAIKSVQVSANSRGVSPTRLELLKQ